MGLPWNRETDDYSFDFGDCHFAVLDGSAEYDVEAFKPARVGFTPEQFAWLAEDLKGAAHSRLRFLAYHYDYVQQLSSLLGELHVDMVFYGHAAKMEYEPEVEGTYLNGHLPGRSAFQVVTVEKGRISVEAGPLYSDLGEEGVMELPDG